jgi:hypothetical protein
VLNLSGNSIYREVECFDDGSIRCVSLSFKDTCEDETQLLGVRFNEYDYGTCAPYKVVEKDHWLFKNIGINRSNFIFGEKSLNQNTAVEVRRIDPGRPNHGEGLTGAGASGWETDKLSKTAPKDFKIVAKGINKYGGADMVVREPRGTSGGVFSSSSIVFAGSLLVDPIVSKIAINAINKGLGRQTGNEIDYVE